VRRGRHPVIRDTDNYGCYKGVPAVIDKDMAAALLGEDCDADELVLLTAVDRVAINFGTEDQRDLADLTVAQARAYADEGQFGKGSMEPKVRAAIRFCEGRPRPHGRHRLAREGPEAVMRHLRARASTTSTATL